MRVIAGFIAVCACAALPASSYGAEAWLQPETLSKPGTFNDSVDIATNSPGVAAVIWTEFANNRIPRLRIRVSTRQPNARWAPSQQLSGAGEAGSGAIGVDPQGRITAVWSEGLQDKMMWAVKLPGQPWSPEQPIPDGDGGNPDLFVASDGTATAVWQKGTTADTLVIRAARRPVNGAWSAVETISPAWSYRPHVEGDTAGNVTVSYSHEGSGSQHYIYAVDRPNSGPWGTQTPLAGPAITDTISELVVAPNSGLATVFWQDGGLTAPMAARTRAGGGWSAATPISGSTAGRLDLDERDRAAVDGMGLVTAVWTAGNKVLTAYRSEASGWTAPDPPAAIDAGDGTTPLESVQVASNAFGRAVATWSAVGSANRYALRAAGAGTPWSAPKPIGGVPADATPLDLAVDDTGRIAYVWSAELGFNVSSLAISTYGNPLQNPQPPAPPGPTPPPPGPPAPPAPPAAKAKVKGTPTTARGVTFLVTMPAAGSATITLFRAGGARRAVAAAAKFRRVGVVKRKLHKGRNAVTVKRIRKHKLARGRYRAKIKVTIAGQARKPIRVAFRIRR